MQKRIMIEITKQRLSAFEDGVLKYNFYCVTGDSKHPTPIGNFKILNKQRERRSQKYNAQMNFALHLTNDGIFIHESYNYNEKINKQSMIATMVSDSTTAVVSNLRAFFPKMKEAELNLGNINLAGSHGCIRLSHSDAEQLFNWCDLNIAVEIR